MHRQREHTEQNPRTEDLIRRVRMMLQDNTDAAIADHFVGDSFTPEEVWLAIQAAKILDKHNPFEVL